MKIDGATYLFMKQWLATNVHREHTTLRKHNQIDPSIGLVLWSGTKPAIAEYDAGPRRLRATSRCDRVVGRVDQRVVP